MKKKLLTIVGLLIAIVCVGLVCVGCSGKKTEDTGTLKVGMICIGDENQSYTKNTIDALEKAKDELAEKGIAIETIYKYNAIEGEPVETANQELVDEGCKFIIDNSYGHEAAMLKVAKENLETYFVCLTNEGGAFDDLPNTLNAFARIHEGRYVAGVVAGMKLNEMIEAGEITVDQAKVGYVGAYAYSEVISGFSAYFLGIRSVCPTATMEVSFVNSWGSESEEAAAAQALIDRGAVMISQHSDTSTPATTAERNDVFHTGYNADMSAAAPKASIISTRVNWTNYFVTAIECIANGTEPPQDYSNGLAEGDVVLTPLNTAIAAPMTQQKIDETIKGIIDGSIKVFDTSTFTVDGQTLTTCFWQDTDGDFIPDKGEAIIGGEFKESDIAMKSAPYFGLIIDGITLINN